MRKMLATSFTAATLATACAVTFAYQPMQNENQPDSQQRRNQQSKRKAAHQDKTGNQNSQPMLTEYFAGKLMLMNESTIAMSEMAQQRSSTEGVKQFAEQLADSHAQLNQKLNEWAPDIAALTASDRSDRNHPAGRNRGKAKPNRPKSDDQKQGQDRRNSVRNDENQNRGAATENQQSKDETPHQHSRDAKPHEQATPLRQILEIERDATQNYLQSSTQMLGRYQGQDFDMGFLGFQIGAHTWALAELKAMDSVGDRQFQQVVREATQKMNQHLKEAQRLSKRLEDDRNRNGRDGPFEKEVNNRR